MKRYRSFVAICILLLYTFGLQAQQPLPIEFGISQTTYPAIGNFTLTISHVNCYLAYSSISSSLPPSSLLITGDVSITSCVGNWTLQEKGKGGKKYGNLFTVSMPGLFPFTWEITIEANYSNYGLVDNFLSNCTLQAPTSAIPTFTNPYPDITPTLNNYTTQVAATFLEQIPDPDSGFCDIPASFVGTILSMYQVFGAPLIQEILDSHPITPPPVNNQTIDGMFDLRDNSIMGLVDYVLNDALGAHGPLNFNEIVNAFTNNTGEYDLFYPSLKIAQTYPSFSLGSDLFGYFTITPKWFNISGLNQWGYTDILGPVGPQTLDTTTILNSLNVSLEFDLVMNITTSMLYGPFLFEELMVIKTNLKDSTLFLRSIVAFSRQKFFLLDPSQYFSPGCLSNALIGLNMSYFNLSFIMDDISVQAEGTDTTYVDTLVDNIVTLGMESFAPTLPYILSSELSLLNATALNALSNVMHNLTCAQPTIDADAWDKPATLFAGIGAIGTFFLIVVAAAVFVRFYENGKTETAPLLAMDERKTNAIIFNPAIPFLVRYGVLLVLLTNIAMFIASNTSLGAAVYLRVKTPNGVTQFPSLFNFSLGNSVRDMWNAEVYALSILIALFSGVWPYTKLLLLVICWCVPASVLTISRRSRILIMLDAMGKWSLIDSFVLMMMMVAFHFSLIPPVTPQTPAGSIAFEAFVEPHFGFYSFLASTMLSLVLTHLAIKVHQFSVETDRAGYVDNSKEALWAHASHGSSHQKAAYLLTFVTLLLATSAVLLGLGISIQSFNFEFRGAFGVLLKFLEDPNPLGYSVLSLGMSFPGSSISPDAFGTRFIQVSFFIFAVAMPIAYLACLLVLWMVPMTYTFQDRLLTLTATIHAWSALEVFVVSIIAALLELRQFAQFIIGDRCDLINKLLAQYATGLLPHDQKCFDVVATLKSGCWVLFSACAIYVIVGALVIRGCHNALKGRSEQRPGNVNSSY